MFFKKNKILKILFAIFIIFFNLFAVSNSYSQESSKVKNISNAAPVILDDKKLFYINTRTGSFDPDQRAEIISERIESLAKDSAFKTDSIVINNRQNTTDIVANNNIIITITDEEAKAAGTDRTTLAENYKRQIASSIIEYRKKHAPKYILLGIFYTLLATLLLFLIFKLFRSLFKTIIEKLNSWRTVKFISFKIRKFEILPVSKILAIIIWVIKVAGIAIEIGLVYIYLVFVLSRFPWTEALANSLLIMLFTSINNIWESFINYLPNIVLIVIISAVAAAIINLIKLIFIEIGKDRLHIEGFYKEWAEPTSKIVRFIIIVASFAIIFPYLPGAHTAAFKGISIFIGALVSFGSTSAITNIIAGIILTYTRAFKIGDRLRVANTIGDVVEQTLLVTRIRTIKYEIISIPNSVVIGSHIINYSSSATQSGLILYTKVTIGYNAPWKKVHELLISAAFSTNNILKEPKPFVFQTSLDNSYITYEINAYTDKPNIMQNIYSELHQNIQDKFNEAGVEIMSPQYSALRDGNKIAIPPDFIDESYQSPSFRINDTNKEQT